MKKFIIITLVFIFIVITPLLIYHFTTLPPKETSGTIVGEVVSTKSETFVYIKPIGDQGTKQLLELRVSEDTSFASGDPGESINAMPELDIGATVEINYTHQPQKEGAGRTIINNIKTVDSQSESTEWPELVLNEDYPDDSTKIVSRATGEVIYVVKLNYPIEGYIVYINHDNEYRIQQYFIEKNNVFLTDNLKELLEQRTIGYNIQAEGLATAPFENSTIRTAFSINWEEN